MGTNFFKRIEILALFSAIVTVSNPSSVFAGNGQSCLSGNSATQPQREIIRVNASVDERPQSELQESVPSLPRTGTSEIDLIIHYVNTNPIRYELKEANSLVEASTKQLSYLITSLNTLQMSHRSHRANVPSNALQYANTVELLAGSSLELREDDEKENNEISVKILNLGLEVTETKLALNDKIKTLNSICDRLTTTNHIDFLKSESATALREVQKLNEKTANLLIQFGIFVGQSPGFTLENFPQPEEPMNVLE